MTIRYICIMRRKIYREDILDAGFELMFLNGYHSTGIKEITDTVGIPKGSFYNHFNSKESFAIEVLQRYCDNGLRDHKETLLENENIGPVERLKKMYDEFIEHYNENDYKRGCFMGNFAQELGDVNENFREVLDLEFEKIENVIAECLGQAKASSEINPNTNTEILAPFVLNSWHGAMIRMKATHSRKPLDEFYSLVFDSLLSS